MRAGDLLLSAGMSGRDVTATMLGIARAYGLAEVQVDVTFTSIASSYHTAPEIPPITYTRVVLPGDVDYSRVRSLVTLCSEIEKGLPLADAQTLFELIWLTHHRQPSWSSTVGNAGVAASVVLIFTTSWPVIAVTFVMGCLVDRMLGWLASKGVPPFFRQVAGAVLVTMIAAGIAAAGAHGVGFAAEINPVLLVTGGIFLLVVGAVIVSAAQDAIDQYYITASARVFEVVVRTAGIVLGIVIAIQLAAAAGLPLPVSAHPLSHGPLAGQLAGATLAAAFFAVYAHSDLVTIAFAAAAGLTAWGIYAAFRHVGAGEAVASASGAMVAALAATIVSRRTHVPAFGLISAAILPLVPGLSLYDGLLQVVGTPTRAAAPALGAATLFAALGTALSIAAGTSLGTLLGRPLVNRISLVRRAGRLRRLLRRRRTPLAE